MLVCVSLSFNCSYRRSWETIGKRRQDFDNVQAPRFVFLGRIRVRKVLSDLDKSIDSVYYYQSESFHYERNLKDFASKLHYLTHCFTVLILIKLMLVHKMLEACSQHTPTLSVNCRIKKLDYCCK